jgi:hypothetical protein
VGTGLAMFLKLGFFERKLIDFGILDMLNKMALVGMKTDRAVN